MTITPLKTPIHDRSSYEFLNDPTAGNTETGMESAANSHIDGKNDANVRSKLHPIQKRAYCTGGEDALQNTAVGNLIFRENRVSSSLAGTTLSRIREKAATFSDDVAQHKTRRRTVVYVIDLLAYNLRQRPSKVHAGRFLNDVIAQLLGKNQVDR
jgi:hypothetical protein